MDTQSTAEDAAIMGGAGSGDNRIRNVVILGGGTAGWMTAAYLGKALQGTVRITVLEAPAIPKIGVGEATVPNLQRVFFDFLGIAEDEWMRECNASFKMAVKFVNWRTPGDGQAPPALARRRPGPLLPPVRPAARPRPDPAVALLVRTSDCTAATDEPFDYACFREPPVMDAKLAPRWLDGRRGDRLRLALRRRTWSPTSCAASPPRSRASMHVAGRDDRGRQRTTAASSRRCSTKSGPTLEGDLFVDCSGFRGLLINKAMDEPFIDMSDHLLCDSAVATAVPHDDEANGVEPYTSSIAMTSGWTWKIPMLGRFGTGYVYSSQFAAQDEATADFCRAVGPRPGARRRSTRSASASAATAAPG